MEKFEIKSNSLKLLLLFLRNSMDHLDEFHNVMKKMVVQ